MEKIIEFRFDGKVESYRRMTRYSKHDPKHGAYWAFKDSLLLQAREAGYRDGVHILVGVTAHVYLPMAKSWSNKKSLSHRYRRHEQKPDVDNLLKAIIDALASEDKMVSAASIQKRWCFQGEECAHIQLLYRKQQEG